MPFEAFTDQTGIGDCEVTARYYQQIAGHDFL
jgi:hypothetical protein